MIIYVKKNQKESTKKLLEVITISNYNKVAGNKVSRQKSVAFLYTSNEEMESEIIIIKLFTLASKNEVFKHKSNKILQIYMRKLQNSNEINKNKNKWRDFLCSWIGR